LEEHATLSRWIILWLWNGIMKILPQNKEIMVFGGGAHAEKMQVDIDGTVTETITKNITQTKL
jgi:hypothetical protein